MTQPQALSILKTGANVFLTGEPGSGKTHTINEYVTYLRAHNIVPAITASTGIAATHIGGVTIHSWSGIGIKTKLEKNDMQRIISNKYVTKRVRKAKVLIIEEVSMLLPETLSIIDTVCRKIKQSTEAFGGMQVVFVGDFFQLPPVVKRETVENSQATLIEKISSRFSYDSPAWTKANPIICYLTEQHRQDDSNFLDILSAIRHNAFNNDHLLLIEARRIEHDVVPDNVPKLFSHNFNVDYTNDKILNSLASEMCEFITSAQGPDALIMALKNGCLSPEVLQLKVGAVVMFTKNNQKEGFVNGTLGVVKEFSKITGYPIVKVRNGRALEVEPMDWTIEEDGKVKARITQLPLRLAWAITVHKSQGMSMDEAVIDLSSVFEFGQGYVALSRVRRLSGVYILGLNKRAFQMHPEILEKDKDFRLASSDVVATFSTISADELQKKQDRFIVSCGGEQKAIKVENFEVHDKKEHKLNTYDQTLALWNSGKTFSQIAETRRFKKGTILDHIEKLIGQGKINRADCVRILTPKLSLALPKIHAVFQELDTKKLSPVFEKIGKVYSYEELRIARMLYEN